MNQRLKRLYQKAKDVFMRRFPGNGGAYVIGILGLVMAASYLMAGGLIPDIERNPENPQRVEIDNTSVNTDLDTLQLVNLMPKPSPTPSLIPGGGSPGPGPGTPGFGTPTPPGGGNPGPGTPGFGTPGPGTPGPSQPPQACLGNTAIALILDLSASMGNFQKIDRLKDALIAFNGQLQDNTVLGVYAFGSPSSYSQPGYPNGAEELIPFVRYGDRRSDIDNLFTNLTQGDLGGTHMRTGFQLGIDKINQAKSTFGSYRFVTILFSDGVPEVSGHWGSAQCVAMAVDSDGNRRCLARAQDPRTSPNLIPTMKNITDRVYSVAIYNTVPGSLDKQLEPYLRALLQEVATSPDRPYYQDTNTDHGDQLTPIFQSIIGGICS